VLYSPEGFEPLVEEPWDEQHVRAGIRGIVADTDDAYDPERLWPANAWDAWQMFVPLKDVYAGAAGIVWALDVLRRDGHAEPRTDLAAALDRALELWLADPAFMTGIELPSTPDASLLCGETGILLVGSRVAPSADRADTLFELVRKNVANEAQELMWGAPGTMLAAHTLHASTGEERWAEARHESAAALLAGRDEDGLWAQRLHGKTHRFLGPAHGLAGNVRALVKVGEGSEALRGDAAAVLAREAVVEGELATWPAIAGGSLEGNDTIIRLQWCHGAPGIVATAADYLDEELLLGGAELTWQAGAHGDEKGHGLCHGTAGNGFALLKTFTRTGDERWLERARRFAVHALLQAERRRAELGVGRYSLFTGDVGTALFAAACLEADAHFPILDRI
jgi:lanthionine synthetase-like protein